jgi:hypothetical protein
VDRGTAPAKPEPTKPEASRTDSTKVPAPGTIAPADSASAKALDETLAQGGRVYATARNNTKRELIVLCPNQKARYQGGNEDLSGRYKRVGSKLTLHLGKKRKTLTISADAKKLTLADKTELSFGKMIDCEQNKEMAPR